MGENGAGKSTLMKILSGAYHADRRRRDPDRRPAGRRSPTRSRPSAHGIAIIYQELSLAPNLTRGREHLSGRRAPPRAASIDRKAMAAGCRPVLERLGAPFKPRDHGRPAVDRRAAAGRDRARAARQVARSWCSTSRPRPCPRARPSGCSRLIRQLRGEGIALIYISHRMAEVYELSDRVSVLRDGTYVGTIDARRADRRRAGEDDGRARSLQLLQEGARPARQPRPGDPRGQGHHRRRPAGQACSFQLHAGRGAWASPGWSARAAPSWRG